jgi:hypothetical protein
MQVNREWDCTMMREMHTVQSPRNPKTCDERLVNQYAGLPTGLCVSHIHLTLRNDLFLARQQMTSHAARSEDE